jgi:hypothetical protein
MQAGFVSFTRPLDRTNTSRYFPVNPLIGRKSAIDKNIANAMVWHDLTNLATFSLSSIAEDAECGQKSEG